MKVNVNVQNVCVPDEDYRGIPYYTTEILRALVNRRNNNYAISFFDYHKERDNRRHINKYFSDFVDNVEIHECNELSYLTIFRGTESRTPSLYNQKNYSEYIKDNPDVYFFPYSAHLPENVTDGKIVVTVHDIIPCTENVIGVLEQYEIDRFKNSIEYIASREDILIAAISEYTKMELIERIGINSNRIYVVPNAYNDKLYYRETNADVLHKFRITKPYLLYLGALSPRKGIKTILESLNFVRASGFQVVFAGAKTKYIDTDALAKEIAKKYDIILTGYVTDVEKRVLLSSAEIFLFPSIYEGFGLPVLEAMACGTPVITTTATSLPEVGGNAAVYIEPQDEEGLAYEIDRLLQSKDLREEYIKRGIERASAFSWTRSAELMEQVFNAANNH